MSLKCFFSLGKGKKFRRARSGLYSGYRKLPNLRRSNATFVCRLVGTLVVTGLSPSSTYWPTQASPYAAVIVRGMLIGAHPYTVGNSITARCFNHFSMDVVILWCSARTHHVSGGCRCIYEYFIITPISHISGRSIHRSLEVTPLKQAWYNENIGSQFMSFVDQLLVSSFFAAGGNDFKKKNNWPQLSNGIHLNVY